MKEFLKKVTVNPWFFLGEGMVLFVAGLIASWVAMVVLAAIFAAFLVVKN